MKYSSSNKYLTIKNLQSLQEQAGVDPEMADLVVAFARLRVDGGQTLFFHSSEPNEEKLKGNSTIAWIFKKHPDLNLQVADFLRRYGKEMARRNLPVIFNVAHFAKKRRMSVNRLIWLTKNQRTYYEVFQIPKASGAARTIMSPQKVLRTQQKWIQKRILSKVTPHPAATAFYRGYSVARNAQVHRNKQVVIRMDLKDFFPSITHRQVRKVFQDLGYPYRVSAMLANLCTVDGKLPQGAITSPALSNLVGRKLDCRLSGLAQQSGFTYTRYADDLVFSSDNSKLSGMIPFFRQIVEEEGFAINEKKTHIQRRSQRQSVTGVVVNEHLNLSRKQVRKLRAACHRYVTQGSQAVELTSRNRGESDPENVLRGHLSYLKMVNPKRGQQLLDIIQNQV